MRWSGGCQCGALRYEITVAPSSVNICHCRMCQKAMGGAYLASAHIPAAGFRWTRGAPASFASSSVAARDFCAACGTPLAFRYVSSDDFSVTLGSLDRPDEFPPTEQWGIESRLSWWRGDGLDAGVVTADGSSPEVDAARNFQHPDQDTEFWPPRPA